MSKQQNEKTQSGLDYLINVFRTQKHLGGDRAVKWTFPSSAQANHSGFDFPFLISLFVLTASPAPDFYRQHTIHTRYRPTIVPIRNAGIREMDPHNEQHIWVTSAALA